MYGGGSSNRDIETWLSFRTDILRGMREAISLGDAPTYQELDEAYEEVQEIIEDILSELSGDYEPSILDETHFA